MLSRRINVKPVIAVPKGSILPADLDCPTITEGSFLEKLIQNMDQKVAIVELSTEELIALVEKPHLFGIDVVALVGVPGGRYDAVWASYIAPLRRVSLDTLSSEIKKIMAAGDPVDPVEAKAAHTPKLPAYEDVGRTLRPTEGDGPDDDAVTE